MRSPSYYSSLANSQPQRGSTNSSLQLRSSFSNPSSSSYATRSHLPFVSQSMLVAHCYTGTTRPYGSHSTLGSSLGATGGLTSSYSRPRYSSHANPYLAASKSPSAYSYSSSSSYTPTSSSSARYFNATSSTLASSSRPASSTFRSSYTPTSSYYKPIRLRERPLLNQISRQINSTLSSASRPTRAEHSAASSRVERRGEKPPEPEEPSRKESIEKNKRQQEESWQSDVARNISRNKYLIKFREIDKRSPESAGKPIDRVDQVAEQASKVQIDQRQVQETTTKRQVKAETIKEYAKEEESISKSMKVPIVVPALIERLEEKPTRKVDTTCLRAPLSQIKDAANEKVDCSRDPNGADLVSVEEIASQASLDESKPEKKKVPREKKIIKLKIKSVNNNAEPTQGERRTTTTKTKKTASPKQSPLESPSAEASATPKAKPKRLVKTSKRAAAEQVATESEQKAASKDSETLQTANKTDPAKASETTQLEGQHKTEAKVNDEQRSTASENQKRTAKKAEQVIKREPVEVVKKADLGPPEANSAAAAANKRIRFRQYHIEDFNFLSVLGHGGWGFVILAELKQHDACFAVKCIKKITIVEDDDFDSIMIERKVLTLGNVHPFICKLFCTFETDGYLFFVMEYCPGGDLMFHVQKEGKFTESRCRFYAAEIICAIRFLHNQHIIYRDLKLDNILLDSQGHIRLVDFGMCQCRTYREEMLPSNFCGTPEYISPEIIKGVPYNHSVDWWSFGVLLYEMAVGKMPFRGNDENELLWNVCYEQIHYPMFLTKELTTLLQSLLEREPTKRMGMATCKMGDIYEQAWFRGVDWPSIEKMRVKPPFVPEVLSKRDVQNFDADFTESAPELSPVDEATLSRIDQNQFQKFPYTNPNIFIFD